MYANWDRLGKISSGIIYLQKIKKQVALALRGYSSQSHTDPDTSDLVWRVANNVREHDLLLFKPARERYPNEEACYVVDAIDASCQWRSQKKDGPDPLQVLWQVLH
jgi:hypothetical protein